MLHHCVIIASAIINGDISQRYGVKHGWSLWRLKCFSLYSHGFIKELVKLKMPMMESAEACI